MRRIDAGHVVVALGVIHTLVGVVAGFRPLGQIIQAGLFNALYAWTC